MVNLFQTPVAFFIFRRPKETSRVFEVIKKIRPKNLLIVADGPRNNNEKILCEETRNIVKDIDWPCEILYNYSETNLGCKVRISTGLDWVFKNVDKAIILEDDCVPNETFFPFCENLLEVYKDDSRIMHIGGINVEQLNTKNSLDQNNTTENPSYYFSNIAQIWGWASWKRAWDKYDLKMTDWPGVRGNKVLNKVINNAPVIDYFNYLFERMYKGELNTWDVAWTYTCMKENGLCIVPNKNLISNIGFGEGATHSVSNKGYVGEMKTEDIIFPLVHPNKIEVNKKADEYVYKKVFSIQSRPGQKLLWFCKSNFPKIYQALRMLSQNIKLLVK